jgi:prevent-host-death family protein
MEKSISAADTNRNFSELLREVREGHTYIITSR